MILADGGEGERATSFGGLVAELIAGLERSLEEKCGLAFADGSPSQHLFLANNTSFVLSRAADADVTSLLGDEWAARHRSRLEQHTARYLQASWGPVVACLETAGGKPAKALAKFNAVFDEMHGSQEQKYVKLDKSVRYTVDDVAQSLSELFEGDAALLCT
ncbi:hypothetical protein U9M48_016806 [Paspalum notatum var. saurae]|uniref:Exocyst subunit Exo70 family protein n=1 Tax=Paspalum notatum var. saurae TaxID=547442 RepID=A0AAQ3WN75_PASNO